MFAHVTPLLTAYIHDELPAHLRARVTRHLESCDACYAAMVQERELARLLDASIATLGTPRPEQLARLLPGILAEVARPSPPRQPRSLPGFGLALVLSLMLALLVPALVAPRMAADHAPDQPAPYMVEATATQSLTDSPAGLSAAPTAVARLDVATQPPHLHPMPAPIAQRTAAPEW